jgi:hypothetical protein
MSTKTFCRYFLTRRPHSAVRETGLSMGVGNRGRAIDAHRAPLAGFGRVCWPTWRSPPRYPNARVRRTRLQESQRLMAATTPSGAVHCNAPLVATLRLGSAAGRRRAHRARRPGLTARSIFHRVIGYLVEAANDDSPGVCERVGRTPGLSPAAGLIWPTPS